MKGEAHNEIIKYCVRIREKQGGGVYGRAYGSYGKARAIGEGRRWVENRVKYMKRREDSEEREAECKAIEKGARGVITEFMSVCCDFSFSLTLFHLLMD